MAIDFRIGEGLNRLIAYKNEFTKKRIVGGVYNAATVGGFRDFNLYNNYIRFEGWDLGRPYMQFPFPWPITRSVNGTLGTVLSDVGGLSGYTYDRYFLENALGLNVDYSDMVNSSLYNLKLEDWGYRYENTDDIINNSASSDETRRELYRKGLYDFTKKRVKTPNGISVTAQTKTENAKRGFEDYIENNKIVASGVTNSKLFDSYTIGYTRPTIKYNGIINIKPNSAITGNDDLSFYQTLQQYSVNNIGSTDTSDSALLASMIASVESTADGNTNGHSNGSLFTLSGTTESVDDLYNFTLNTQAKRNLAKKGLYYYSEQYREKNNPAGFITGRDYALEREEYENKKQGTSIGFNKADEPVLTGDYSFIKTGEYSNYEFENYQETDFKNSATNISEGYNTEVENIDRDNLHSSKGSVLYNTQAGFVYKDSTVSGTSAAHAKRQIHSLINRFHTENDSNNSNGDAFEGGKRQFETALTKKFGFSRGRNLLTEAAYNNGSPNTVHNESSNGGYDNPYCRVWTQRHQYARLKDRIRPFIDKDGNSLGIETLQGADYLNLGEKLRPNNGASRLGTYSVLQNNGFVKITPTSDEFGNFDGIKKYMFSIENLAWRDANADLTRVLSPEQIGPNKGRIMWFPPYDLKFTDNANVEWNANQFIGRGEKIYTYTDTERHGTLSFTILVDHPSIVDKWRGTTRYSQTELIGREQELLRFFAGCSPLTSSTLSAKEEETSKETEVENKESQEPTPEVNDVVYNYVIFFPNNYSGVDTANDETLIDMLYKYDSITAFYSDEEYANEVLKKQNIKDKPYDSPLNDTTAWADSISGTIVSKLSLTDEENVFTMKTLENDLKGEGRLRGENLTISKIEYVGNASSHGYNSHNNDLCKNRANAAKRILTFWANGRLTENETQSAGTILSTEDTKATEDINKLVPRIGRSAIISITVHTTNVNIPSEDEGTETKILENAQDISVLSAYTTIQYTAEQVKTNKTVQENINKAAQYGYKKLTYSDDSVTLYKEVVNPDDVSAHGGTLDEAVLTAEKGPGLAESLENEYTYFNNLKDTDNLLYSNIAKKIEFFDPAFHSITPEGFNERLTFLHQCTRQGPTKAIDQDGSSRAGNLAFGRAPYCILRIGDFFHSKILIDSLTLDFDTGTGIQYDLNPEGIGVQPMMAKVNITFKFIGGQDISNPIERLQNAVSFNYYANSSIHDARADYYAIPENSGNTETLKTVDIAKI